MVLLHEFELFLHKLVLLLHKFELLPHKLMILSHELALLPHKFELLSHEFELCRAISCRPRAKFGGVARFHAILARNSATSRDFMPSSREIRGRRAISCHRRAKNHGHRAISCRPRAKSEKSSSRPHLIDCPLGPSTSITPQKTAGN
ncbi:hypothetical protein [Lentibacillus jeotgali]|uniref:hypothetical protein n=1 Tax=Lentibacillus jeotgali TaxID=558169 RepID=UPI00110FD8DC|nr:hypothetical protein [Lentibacillus jeotgali]